MFRKITKTVATILSIVLIIDGLYKVLATGTNDWGLIVVVPIVWNFGSTA